LPARAFEPFRPREQKRANRRVVAYTPGMSIGKKITDKLEASAAAHSKKLSPLTNNVVDSDVTLIEAQHLPLDAVILKSKKPGFYERYGVVTKAPSRLNAAVLYYIDGKCYSDHPDAKVLVQASSVAA
jgi:hypothetical protein